METNSVINKLQPSLLPFIKELQNNLVGSKPLIFLEEESYTGSGIYFDLIPKVPKVAEWEDEVSELSLLDQHTHRICDRFNMVISYAGILNLQIQIIMNINNMKDFDFSIPDHEEFEDYLTTLEDDLPLNLWDPQDPTSLSKVIKSIRKELKKFELGKVMKRICMLDSIENRSETSNRFVNFLQRLDSSNLIKTCEYCRLNRSDNGTHAKKSNHLFVEGEIPMEYHESVKVMTPEESKFFFHATLDFTTMRILKLKWTRKGNLNKFILSEDKYFNENEGMLIYDEHTDDTDLLDHIAHVKGVVLDFANKVSARYEAKKDFMIRLSNEFGPTSIRNMDTSHFHDCMVCIYIEDEANEPAVPTQVIIRIVCGPSFPMSYPDISVSARRNDWHTKTIRPAEDLGNVGSMDDVIATIKDLIEEVVKKLDTG